MGLLKKIILHSGKPKTPVYSVIFDYSGKAGNYLANSGKCLHAH